MIYQRPHKTMLQMRAIRLRGQLARFHNP